MDIKGDIHSNTIIVVEDFSTTLTSMDGPSRQKINKEIMPLHVTLDQINLIDIYRTFHPQIAEYIFLSSAHRIFFKIDHIRPQNKPQ